MVTASALTSVAIMPTVLRIGPYRVIIFTNDHPPAHVHVARDGRMVKVGLQPIQILEYDRELKKDLGKVKAIVEDNLQFLLDRWNEIHP